MTTIETEAEKTLATLRTFMPAAQLDTILSNATGEEGEYFAAVLLNIIDTVEVMPVTYKARDNAEALVWLHYFGGPVDAWIIEKDKGDPENGDTRQTQAFGAITLTGNRADAEIGYINIEELIEHGIELDLHWKPKPLNEICVR